jgi:hypothetical protein
MNYPYQIRRTRCIGDTVWYVYKGPRIIKFFSLKREAIAWILEQEAKQ